jgi:cytochrome c-type biogenesis protein
LKTLSPITVPLAFAAGLLSFVSPCVVPLVPVYLSYLSGSSLSGETPPSRPQVFGHALFFVGGFTLAFTVLFGLPTTLLGSTLETYSRWIAKVGGAVLILFGLHTMRVITLPFLDAIRRVEIGEGVTPSYARSVLVGVTFGAGWTPCIGPLLSTVVMLAFTEPSRAVGYTFVYAMGLAVPFLVTALLLTRAVDWLRRLNRHMRVVEVVSGLLMVGVGVLLIGGALTVLNTYFIRITPEWLLRYL